MDLEAELDALFRAPVSAFVSARNQLVQSLRRAGERDVAGAIAKLERPTPVAWVVNQLHFEARDLLDTLRVAGASLRSAQESGTTAEEYAARKEAHRVALRTATDRAFAIATGHRVNLTADVKRRIELNLQLVSATTDVRPPPGRMTAELEPLGFDALSVLAPPAPAPRPTRTEATERAERAERLAPVREALAAAEKEARRLASAADVAESAAARAVRDVHEAAQRVEALRAVRTEAERAAAETRSRADAALGEVEAAKRALEELEAPR